MKTAKVEKTHKKTFAEQVLDAFTKLQITPLFGWFCDDKQMCGLTALALATGALKEEHLKSTGSLNPVYFWASSTFGSDFTCGFMRGFDGKEREHKTIFTIKNHRWLAKWIPSKSVSTTIDVARFFAGYDAGKTVRERLLRKE